MLELLSHFSSPLDPRIALGKPDHGFALFFRELDVLAS
jgi:hypothetical protein